MKTIIVRSENIRIRLLRPKNRAEFLAIVRVKGTIRRHRLQTGVVTSAGAALFARLALRAYQEPAKLLEPSMITTEMRRSWNRAADSRRARGDFRSRCE